MMRTDISRGVSTLDASAHMRGWLTPLTPTLSRKGRGSKRKGSVKGHSTRTSRS